jgi:hypothetical protein
MAVWPSRRSMVTHVEALAKEPVAQQTAIPGAPHGG